ncbi:unnamed protein product [Closterium sp. NIES-64]|nr:unnamed protein product [Closterium sp. NIES-64]
MVSQFLQQVLLQQQVAWQGTVKPGASAGASAEGVGQPGAAAVMLAAAASLRGALPAAAAGQTGAAGGVPTVPTGQTGAAAVVPTASTGQTGAAVSFTTLAAGHAGPATGAPTALAGHATAAAGVPTGAASLWGSAADVPAPAAGPPGGSAGVHSAVAWGQAAIGRPIKAAVVQPTNESWDLVGPPTELTMFHEASSSMVPTTQGGEISEVPGKKGWTGITKKLDKDEWIARIVLDRASQLLIVINSHFESEEEAARSIAAASHVMFVDKPTRGELIPLTAADKAKLKDCSAHQCEVMVRMKFWHMWEEWRKYWPAGKAKWAEKVRKDEKKRAAINASLDEAEARADKIARKEAGGNAGAETASHQEGSGSKDG